MIDDELTKRPKTGFSRGFRYPFTSISFINTNPGLATYIIIPFLLNVTLFSLVVYYGFGFFQEMVLSRIPDADAWYWFFLHYLLLALGIFVILMLVFFTFTVIGSLIASPFNDLLSERTEAALIGNKREELFSFSTFIEDAKRTLRNQLRMVGMFIAGMLLLLLLNFLPVIGSVMYSVLSVLWVIFFLIVEYTGYVFSRKRLLFKEQRHLIYSRFSMMFGFGCALFCILAIPFMQFVIIPLGVVGGTRMLFDEGVVGEELFEVVK